MQPDLTKPWENWYLTAVQTANVLIDVSLEDVDDNHIVFQNKNVWKIYLSMNYNNGIFRSSSIVNYDKTNKTIKTNRGSIYKLGEPINTRQWNHLENFLSD